MTDRKIFGVAVALTIGLVATTLPGLCEDQKPQPAAHNLQSRNQGKEAENPGEKKFEQNCSRCHNAPETLSPRTNGTVLRHMRVRANLSRQDERDILQYLNPQ